ncbi:hypothetical protein K3495_g13890 [Podosphaera aphanis]|nr:hypothetical protein K3495_g13890 [Podosphaera aphanis]
MSASPPFPPPEDVNMSDESRDVLSNLSSESLQGLVRLLIGSNAQAPPSVARRDVVLVKWDGDQREFPFYIQLLEARIEEEMDGVLSDRSICLDMVNSLPAEKRPRVASWFNERSETKGFSWREFIQHFRNEFEDKQARLAVSEKLLRMEQNDHQYFGDFIKDFEYQVAISGGSRTWTPSSRVNLLNAAINHSLRKSLVSVKLPSDENYSAWVAEVKEVADKLEALPEYRPRGSTKTSTRLGPPKSGSVLARSRESVQDQDGDTIMRDVDSILAAVSHLLQDRQISSVASVNSRPTKGEFQSEPNSSRKPPAPWRSKREFDQLVRKSVCVRCTRPGHIGRDCRKFGRARRPGSEVCSANVTQEEGVEEDSSISGNEEA